MSTRTRTRRPVCVAVLAALIGFLAGSPLSAGSRDDSLTVEVQVATRIGPNGGRSLLLEVRSGQLREVEGLQIKLTRSAAENARPGMLPEGWTLRREKDLLSLNGPPAGLPLRVRVGLGAAAISKQVQVIVLAKGFAVFKEKVRVAELRLVESQTSLDGVLLLPPLVSPGDELEFEVLNPRQTPAGGRWIVGGSVAREESSTAGSEAPQTHPHLLVTLPSTLAAGAPLTVTYEDSWGERVVDVPNGQGVRVVPPRAEVFPTPRVTGCNGLVGAGDALCLCGFFPLPSRKELIMDGQPAGAPISASSHVVYLRVPESVKPGMRLIAGQRAAGFPGTDQVAAQVVSVRAEVDLRVMISGESRRVQFFAEGTQHPVRLQLTNRTPSVVSLEGGNDQVLTTSGGSPNLAERTVHAIRGGTFDLGYHLLTPPCPCADEEPRKQNASPEIAALLGNPLHSGMGGHVPQRILTLVPLESAEAMQAIAEVLAHKHGLRVENVYPLASTQDGLIVYSVPPGTDLVAKSAELEANPSVRLAQPDLVHETAAVSGEPYSQLQYGRKLIRADRLPPSANGEGIRIGLVDTGVDTDHVGLRGKLLQRLDATGFGFTPDMHGTLVAGILVSESKNGSGIDGVAPRAQLLAAKACEPVSPQAVRSLCWSSALARGLDFLVQGRARVVNLSLAGFRDRLVERVVLAAVNRGTIVVAAAGNDGPKGPPTFPAALEEVITVTAVDAAEQLYPAATRGPFIALAAPGVEIVSTAPGNQFVAFSGTSAAAPFASGAVALLLQQQPSLSRKDVQNLLERTAKDLGPPGKDPQFGNGLLDICRAMSVLSGPPLSCGN